MRASHRKVAFLSSFATAAVFLTINGFLRNWNQHNSNLLLPLNNVENGASLKKDRIVMAVVICSKPGDTEDRDEAAVMIKSTIISWHLYHFNVDFEFHLFLEHKEDQHFFLSKLKEFGHPHKNLDIRLVFHSALDAAPVKYRNEMNFNERFRCTYVRIFLPDILPDVDSVLYLDTDNIILGNLSLVWNHLPRMSGEQLVGALQDVVTGGRMLNPYFDDIPFPPPKGLNAGFLLMNLTRMRQYGFVEKLLRVYADYTHFVKDMNDQKLINIFLYFDQGLLYKLPCQYNVWYLYCKYNSFCSDAEMDPDGILAVHGSGHQFWKGGEMYHLYNYYKQVNMTDPQLDWQRDLIIPIRKTYLNDARFQCDQRLANVLFKSVAETVENQAVTLN